MTFFGSFKSRFEDVPGGEDGPATALFLSSCSEIVGVFSECRHARQMQYQCSIDILGSTAFTPVKMDINGNIKVRSIQSIKLFIH